MLNFRKLKKDYSPAILKEGQTLYKKDTVVSAKVVTMTPQSIRLNCQVMGSFDNKYQCEIEIDLNESMTTDSDCDCPYQYDCQHLAAVLFYLEEHIDGIVVDYSKEANVDQEEEIDEEEKKTLKKTFKQAATKESARQGKKKLKELLEEYVGASQMLGKSPFFLPEESFTQDKAELAVIFSSPPQKAPENKKPPEIQLALRLPYRSKPLNIPDLKTFLNAVRYHEPLYIGSKRYFFTLESFDPDSAQVLKMVMDFTRLLNTKDERNQRVGQIDAEVFGMILAQGHDLMMSRATLSGTAADAATGRQAIPCLYYGGIEEPLRFSPVNAVIQFDIEFFETPEPKILLTPRIALDNKTVTLEDASLFESAKPGVIYNNVYYRFQPHIKRKHLRNLSAIRDITIPEPLFGTFIENSLTELMRFSHVKNRDKVEHFVTLPYAKQLKAECDIHYLNGELEASVSFIYDTIKVPAAASQLTPKAVSSFITDQGILARNLTEEQKIIEDIFQGFTYDPAQGLYVAKSEKKIVDFMTEIIPRNQDRVQFNCPENLLDQFLYDDTSFTLSLKESSAVDCYEVDLEVNGYLEGITLDLLWECLSSRKAFIELVRKDKTKKKGAAGAKLHKILVLDLDKLAPVVQIFDEIGVGKLDTHKENRPLWSLAGIDASSFEGLPIKFSMSKKLKEIQEQILGMRDVKTKPIPKEITTNFRDYQVQGVHWLDRLRQMHLNGVLADDMGLGKTLQAITVLTQHKQESPKSVSIIVCPTSLVYNWKEEFAKFSPKMKVLVIDGTPAQRKKLIAKMEKYDIIVTSYSLVQKDIAHYESFPFAYAILDEAQNIKNRGTRNARSVKQIQASHRLILTGTPIENSLDELWSLFDFLMPGLLSSYDRFVEKYIRNPNQSHSKNLEILRKKVSPFILRRMKSDVLEELPPISEIIYHCHLSEKQQELYRSYAKSAREELSQLVKKEGFDKVQIHVLATLTRLKQICCHPAIFAKESPDDGDSTKYDMLMDLLQTLIEGNHKTVIFSQYTRMLQIMREDLTQKGIRFEYLDGSSKNRLSIVKKFNEDQNIPVFLVSLKAGGSGLNLVGADTVIHFDMWWNPAVEKQATDRTHRIGQKRSVSSYKFVTLGTIEEKILELQNRKKGLVKKVVNCDEEAMSKLTWEEVLELLQT